jgi:hypothetical protein
MTRRRGITVSVQCSVLRVEWGRALCRGGSWTVQCPGSRTKWVRSFVHGVAKSSRLTTLSNNRLAGPCASRSSANRLSGQVDVSLGLRRHDGGGPSVALDVTSGSINYHFRGIGAAHARSHCRFSDIRPSCSLKLTSFLMSNEASGSSRARRQAAPQASSTAPSHVEAISR